MMEQQKEPCSSSALVRVEELTEVAPVGRSYDMGELVGHGKKWGFYLKVHAQHRNNLSRAVVI